MLLNVDLTLPFEEPVLIFTLVLLIILMIPIVLNKLRIPGIVGLIVAGVIVGPNGLHILSRDASIELFGTVGLLYIMFQAGLEIDMIDFKRYKVRSLIFGTLTFLIPMVLGTVVFFYLHGYQIKPAILLASMFAPHTLLAYPIVSRFGLSKNEAVTLTIGGTLITDTAVLFVLAIIINSTQGSTGVGFWLWMITEMIIFVGVVLWLFPKIAKWMFKQLESEKGAQYIFVLTVVFAAAFLSELAGMEAIIGAFLAGLALNPLIPHTSALMNRIEFVGNNIFIPFFLISTGMLVDLTVLFTDTNAMLIAGTIVVLAPLAKFLAAYVTQKLFKFSVLQRNLIFGLSSAHAAATLAVVLAGFEIGIIGESALNGAVVLILVSSMVSSFSTEKVGRKLAILESRRKPDISEKPDRIMVPIGNPKTIESLIDLAVMLKNPDHREPIYPLAVVIDNEHAEEEIYKKNKMLQEAIRHASASDNDVQLVSKIDINVPSGILRAIKELMITEVVLGWNAKITTRDRIFGTVLDNLLENTEQMILVCKIIQPLNTTGRIVVIVPTNAELERGFLRWIRSVKLLSQQLGAKLVFRGRRRTLNKMKAEITDTKPTVEAEFIPYTDLTEFASMKSELKPDDMVVVISARKRTISYNSNLDYVPRVLSRNYKDNSFIVIYPEQYPIYQSVPVKPAAFAQNAGNDQEEE
ncbi:transporter (CPA2 family) [Pontibacter ummariensis]|uniref:Transporter, CPA2 family n=1 Tax=Pontibacter ummariensis TaxID=1610492 RepID=A0A239CIP0_9BACT|nr:cation:proton antiporter [Pontibacter ummariensis]PRY15001.1 transporter (CPA2 family) [Pontibacter ummariensis]SNS19772.1 transporter, CPA2 family [Pontibacter ummariensis]